MICGLEIIVYGNYVHGPRIVAYSVTRGTEYERLAVVSVDAHGKVACEPQVAHEVLVAAPGKVEEGEFVVVAGIAVFNETQFDIGYREKVAYHYCPLPAAFTA